MQCGINFTTEKNAKWKDVKYFVDRFQTMLNFT